MCKDEKKYTERELILAKREAHVSARSSVSFGMPIFSFDREAAKLYPLKMPNKPKCPKCGNQYSRGDGTAVLINGSKLEISLGPYHNWHPEDLRAIADVLENPEVDV